MTKKNTHKVEEEEIVTLTADSLDQVDAIVRYMNSNGGSLSPTNRLSGREGGRLWHVPCQLKGIRRGSAKIKLSLREEFF